MHTGVLNRAEWFKFLGMFFNMDAAANELFDSINSSYYATAAEVVPGPQPPVVAFVDLYDYAPDVAYEVSFAPYKLQYTQARLGPAWSLSRRKSGASLPLMVPKVFLRSKHRQQGNLVVVLSTCKIQATLIC